MCLDGQKMLKEITNNSTFSTAFAGDKHLLLFTSYDVHQGYIYIFVFNGFDTASDVKMLS